MAPKRKGVVWIDKDKQQRKKKGEGSSSQRPSQDLPPGQRQDIFVSAAAAKRYDESVSRNRNFINERGFDLGDHAYEGITPVIRRLGWEKFCAPPDAAVEQLVKEFYANVFEHRSGQVRVRGVKVAFDATTINQLYELPDYSYEEDEYAQYAKAPDLEAVIQSLTGIGSGATWEPQGQQPPSRFDARYLSRVHRAWQYFVCARLMPATTYSSLDRHRAILLYAIKQGMRMNVGQIIYFRLLEASHSKIMGYAFPTIVTTLCIRAGVQYSPHEVLRQPGPRLTMPFIDNITSGIKAGEDASRAARGSHEAQAGGSSSAAAGTDESAEMQHWRTWVTSQLAYQSAKMDYMSEMSQSMFEMLRLQMSQTHIDYSHVHVPGSPAIPCPGPYVPLSQPTEEETYDEDEDEEE